MGVMVLDANVLIAFSRRDHVHHSRAVAVLARSGLEMVVNPITMAEYLVKSAQAGRDVAGDMDRLCQRAQLRLAREAELENGAPWPAFLAMVRAQTGLKMPDAIVVATAWLLGATIGTFDGALVKAADRGLVQPKK